MLNYTYKVDEVIDDCLHYISKGESRIIFIDGKKTEKTSFLKELLENLKKKGNESHYFRFPGIDSEYHATKRTYITEIITRLKNNIMKAVKKSKKEDLKRIEVQWDNNSGVEGKIQENFSENTEKNGRNTGNRNKEGKALGEIIEIGVNRDSDPENIEKVMSNILNTLGPMMKNLTEKLKGSREQLQNDDKISEKSKKVNDEENISDKNEEIKDEFEPNNFNPMSLLTGLLSNLKKSQMEFEESSEKFESKPDLKETDDNLKSLIYTRSKSESQKFSWDAKNNKKNSLGPKEHGEFIQEIKKQFQILSLKKGYLILLFDDVDQAQEMTYSFFNEIIMENSKMLPIIIIGAYETKKGQPGVRGINNKYLRMLLTRFKIEKIGKSIKLSIR
ncbi:MAG: hypothetical protein ACTSWY_03430 [Promethearchaeota archaeon]